MISLRKIHLHIKELLLITVLDVSVSRNDEIYVRSISTNLHSSVIFFS